MTLDGLLTVLTLVLAALAIMSPVERLRLQLHGTWPLILGGISGALVLYLQFFDLLKQPCPGLFGRACAYISLGRDSPISPAQLSFVVALAWMAFATVWVRRKRVSRTALSVLARLVGRLESEQRYSEIIDLVEPNLPVLQKVSRTPKKRGRTKDASDRIFGVLFGSPGLEAYLVRYRSDFAVSMLRAGSDQFKMHDFFGRYLLALISEQSSRLFEEVRNNQNVSASGRYFLPDENTFLRYLFSDPTTAEKLGAWRPVGEAFIKRLDKRANPEYLNVINGPATHFEDDKWRDPSFVTIRFFDIMVMEAAFSDVRWHMWLFYFPHFVDAILAVHDESAPDIDKNAEWPTVGLYLIYEIFSGLRGWVLCLKHLGEGSTHRQIERTDAQHQNDNIPKSAAIALGMCFETLLLNGKVSERFKRYITEICLSTVAQLSTQGEEARLRQTLILSILREGRSPQFGARARIAYRDTDHVLQAKIADFRAELARLYP